MEVVSQFVKWLILEVGKSLFNANVLNRKESDAPQRNLVNNYERNSINIEEDLSEAKKISKRFKTVLKLMNENRVFSPFTIARLAKVLSFSNVAELEWYFRGELSPSFDFLNKFSEILGINEEWLTEGNGNPYESSVERHFYPMDYFDLIIKNKPEKIFFVKERSNTSPAFIVLKLEDWKYLVINRSWHISNEVGNGGQRQLVSIYNLINELRNKGFSHKCSGVILVKEEFEALYNGQVFPGKHLSNSGNRPWWDDLTDIYHKYPIAKDYKDIHGDSFIDAQNIIKWRLEDKEKNMVLSK